MNSTVTTSHKDTINQLIVDELKKQPNLLLINISSIDGFPLHQAGHKSLGIESDKIAAISSSLYSMANSASQTLFTDTNNSMNIECDSGKIIFQQIKIKDKEAVITVCSKDNLLLAEARFITNRLKSAIESLFN